MAKKPGGIFDDVKKQIAATAGIIITTGGALVVANMEKIFGAEEAKVEDKKEIVKDSIKPKEPKTIIIKEVPAEKPKAEPKKKTETEQRKDEGFDW
jgi:ribosomal protein S24E